MNRSILASGFGLATLVLGFDRQGWITVFAALLLALITLFTNYTHVDLAPPHPPGQTCHPDLAGSSAAWRCGALGLIPRSGERQPH
jgi:hypothetical protein